MKRETFIKAILIAILTTSTVFIARAASKDDIAKLLEATAQFQSTPAARDAGYALIPALDYCFQSHGTGGLGYRFINTQLLDTTVDLLHPEAMIYSPDSNGSIQLGAVEYMVPADAWEAQHTELPQVLDQNFHLDERLGMYVLRAWIWKNNPFGMFEDWNPDVFCPAPLIRNGPTRAR